MTKSINLYIYITTVFIFSLLTSIYFVKRINKYEKDLDTLKNEYKTLNLENNAYKTEINRRLVDIIEKIRKEIIAESNSNEIKRVINKICDKITEIQTGKYQFSEEFRNLHRTID